MRNVGETIQDPRLSIEVVYAGGTISSVVGADGARMGGTAMDLIGELNSRVPDFEGRFNIAHREVAYTGLSENMDYEYWEKIEAKVAEALERNPNGVLVTHGTESMEQTARRLDQGKIRQLLEQKGAKVILTGANDDLSWPETDAWDNLGFALDCMESDVPAGVYIAFGNKLIPAAKAVKKPFDYEQDKGMQYIANDDPDYVTALQKQKAEDDRIIAELEAALAQDQPDDQILEYGVNVVRPNHDEFRDLVATVDPRVVLLTLYHGGTANTENPDMDVAKLVEELRKTKGIVFFAVTENGEPVNLHAYETSVKLRQAGLVPLYNMTRAVAFAKLRLAGKDMPGRHLIGEMLTDRVGEIDETLIIREDIEQLVCLYDPA